MGFVAADSRGWPDCKVGGKKVLPREGKSAVSRFVSIHLQGYAFIPEQSRGAKEKHGKTRDVGYSL